MKLLEDEVRVTAPDCEILATMITPVGEGPWPGMLLYTDIFQRTESTRGRRGGWPQPGLVVCVPEIYPHVVSWPVFRWSSTTRARKSGLAGAAATTTAQFDSDRIAVLDFLDPSRGCRRHWYAVGVSASAATWRSEPRSTRVITATVCFYPTGLHNGALGADRRCRARRLVRTPSLAA